MTAGAAILDGALRCVPHSANYFGVDGAIIANGVTADIRRYGWERPCDSWFEWPVCYLDYALSKRTVSNSMLPAGQRYYQHAGDIVFLPAGSRFLTRCSPGEQHSLCVTIDRNRVADALGAPEQAIDEQDVCMDVRDRRVEACLLRLVDEVRQPGFASAQLVESITTVLMVEIYRHLRQREFQQESGGKLAGWRLKRLKERIHTDVGASLSIAELAQECGISARHLIRTFKNTEGVTLSDYIARERISRAKTRLASGAALVKEIAGECGFGSAASFSAAFRRATGKTPKEFRADTIRYG